MLRRLAVVLVLVSLCCVALTASTPWTGVIAPSRAMDWSNVGVTGGIPNRTTICATLNPGASASQISSAIASCPAGQVVQLNAGTFNLSGIIVMKDNVTLRGQGMSTILNFSSCGGTNAQYYWAASNVCITMQGSGFTGAGDNVAPGAGGVPAATIRDFVGTNGQTGVYTQGATVLNLSSAPTGLTVGGTITLWQSDPPPNTLPNNGYWVSDKNKTGVGDISWKGSAESQQAGQTQRSKVLAINGTAVTIAPPGITRPTGTWATALAPKAGWQSGVLIGAGIENLRIVRPQVNGVIGINAAADCWITGVGLTGSTASADTIRIYDSRNLTIRNNWLDPATGGGNGNWTSYGLVPTNTSNSLFENNIINQVQSPLEILTGSTGNVFAYNFEINSGSLEGGFQTHEEGPAMNLVEGNIIKKFWSEDIHGSTALNTLFRNYFFSTDVGVDIWTYNRWYNLIGNLMAANAVYKSLYTDSTLYTRWGGASIRLGYASQYGQVKDTDPADVGTSNVDADPLVVSSTMLWGNFSAAGNSTRWLASEVPAGDAVFPNPVPSSQALPASFYYSGRPAWWPASKPWPAIGPDVTGGTSMAGHAYTLPAQDCYQAAGGNIANFNPAVCYATTSTPPSAPTNFRIIP